MLSSKSKLSLRVHLELPKNVEYMFEIPPVMYSEVSIHKVCLQEYINPSQINCPPEYPNHILILCHPFSFKLGQRVSFWTIFRHDGGLAISWQALVRSCDILFNIIHSRSNILLRWHVPTLCPIYNHPSFLIPEIYFELLHLVSFEFEDGLYPPERNSRVVRYTKYIIDITQDILILIKAVGLIAGRYHTSGSTLVDRNPMPFKVSAKCAQNAVPLDFRP